MGILTAQPSSITDAPSLPKGAPTGLAVLFGADSGSTPAELQRNLEQRWYSANWRFERAGLLTVTKQGNQKHYRPMQRRLCLRLRELVLKTTGLADVLRAALVPLAARTVSSTGSMPLKR
jgi:hypothetical protein